VSKYLAALKGQYFHAPAPRVLQNVQEAPYCSFCSTQVPSVRKYQGGETAANDRPGSTAAPAEAAELRALIPLAFAGASEADLAEVFATACADPDAALTSFHALAANAADASRAPAEDADDRRRCIACMNLTAGGACLAARRGERPGNAPRDYHPVLDVPRRCEHYRPKPGEPDQRPGAQRWPAVVGDTHRLQALAKSW
jgi:hypothetical protein